MADNENDLSGKVGLDITDFKTNISELNRQIRVIDSGFKAAAAGIGDWGSSAEGLQGRIKSLSDIIDLQNKKVEALSGEYKKVAAEKGADSKAAQDLQIRINKETESLNKNQKELQDTTTKLNSFGKEEDQETEKTNKFHGALGKMGDGLKNIGGAVGKAAVAGIAAVGAAAAGAAAGMWKMATSSADYADGVQKASDVTGLTSERVQELTYAGANLGVEFDTIAGAQAKLTKSMDAAKGGTGKQADAFKKLGISITDSNGQLRDSKDVMTEAFNKLNVVGNETERDALAMQMFGKSAMDLNPLIKAGGDELARLTDEANKNGAVLSGSQVAALDAFGDSTENLKMSVKGLAANITTAALPAFNGLISNVQNITTAVGAAVKTGDWTQVGVAISDGLNSVISQISGMLPGLANMSATIIGGIANSLVTAIPTVLPPLILATLQLLNVLLQTLTDNGPMLIAAGISALMLLISGLVNALPQLISTAIQIIMALANGLIDNLPSLIDSTIQIMSTLVDGIINLLPELIPAAIEIILKLALGLIDALPKLIEKVPKIIETIVKTLVDNLPLIIDAALKIIIALTVAIVNNLPLIIESAIKIIGALVSGILGAVGDLIAVVPELFKSLKDAFNNINWSELGSNLINGIINGVKNAAVGLANSVANAAKNALDAAKNALGIHSPSTVMRDQVGMMIGAGMAEGITGSAGLVNNAMRGLNRQLTSDAINMTSNITVNGKASGSNQKALEIKIINQGTLIGTNGMKEFADIVSQRIAGKFGLSAGGAW